MIRKILEKNYLKFFKIIYSPNTRFNLTNGTMPVCRLSGCYDDRLLDCPFLGKKMKKSISVLLLFIFSIISWIIWIIEVNPFITNTWDWIDEKKITFVVTPILFLLWAYFSRLITRVPRFIINYILYIFWSYIVSDFDCTYSGAKCTINYIFTF